MNYNGFKFAKVMDYSDSGELIFIGFIRVDNRKGCPNCFATFLKMGNRHKIFADNGKNEFNKCPFCKCMIKTHKERRSVLIWILLLTIGCVFVLGLYHYFPGYMFLCLPKKFISVGIVTVCALFVSVIMKISTNSKKNTDNYTRNLRQWNIMQFLNTSFRNYASN